MKLRKQLTKLIHRIKWILAPYINFSSPTHIDIELSTRCNLDCAFCFRKEAKYKRDDISHELLDKIIHDAAKWKNLSIKFNWRGEAVLHPNFFDIIRHFKNKGYITELNTSLSQDLTVFDIFSIASNIDRLSISIDSANSKIYESVRKGAKFLRTWTNFLNLRWIRCLENMPKIIVNRRTSKLTEKESNVEFKNTFRDSRGETNVIFNISPAQARNKGPIYTGGIITKKRKYCGQPSRRMVIGVDGKVWACCHAYKEQTELYLGDINLYSLQEIWDGVYREMLVAMLKDKNFQWPEVCLQCQNRESYK
jgi:radical SAM protein with 4Fe4S-binding SPASM domain